MTKVAMNQREQADSLARNTAPCENAQKCVLLIEDSEEAMFLVRCALQEHGKGLYRLLWADGLSEGLTKLEKGGVDLVLLDLGLPESSGPASYAWVREVAPEIPVLVLTGDEREETEFAIAACGVEDYLVKDRVSGSLLIQAIRAALHTTKRGDRRKSRAAEPEHESNQPARIRRFVPSKPDCHN